MADRVVVCVGTKRGLFVLESGARRDKWELRGPYLKGWEVNHATVDTRGTPRICAAASNFTFGTTVFTGDVKRAKFDGAKKPPAPPKLPAKALKFAEKYGISTTPRVWHVEPARAREKGVLYAGVAPAALFRSEDAGTTWEEVPSLTRHPTRENWDPGAGGMCLHSIQCDPADDRRMTVAISAAGAFRTDDGGKSWKPINRAVAKYVGAPKDAKVGTCVHKLLAHPGKPGRVYQQNHVGVYRSDDHGDTWYAIHKDLPYDFGFGLALDVNDPEACFTVPLEPMEYAWRATDGAMRVYRWNGKGWAGHDKGLPRKAYVSVLREGMSADTLDPCGVYVGTGSGAVFASPDGGRRWATIASHLPPVYSVSAQVV